MAFCKLGRKLCQASSKPAAAVNAVFFSELGDIAVRTYNSMARRGTLGEGEIRFKVRMFMQTQLATNTCVLHTSPAALNVFTNCVDEFIALHADTVTEFKRIRAKKSTASSAKQASAAKDHTGCYLCPSATHQAWDTNFHPRNPDGSRPKVSAEDKKKIIQRIQASSKSTQEKAEEEATVRAYWAKHSL